MLQRIDEHGNERRQPIFSTDSGLQPKLSVKSATGDTAVADPTPATRAAVTKAIDAEDNEPAVGLQPHAADMQAMRLMLHGAWWQMDSVERALAVLPRDSIKSLNHDIIRVHSFAGALLERIHKIYGHKFVAPLLAKEPAGELVARGGFLQDMLR